VAGAIALLLERKPELTQALLRALLQAGARQPTGTILDEQQAGAGALDIRGSLAALIAEDSPVTRLPSSTSRIVLAASFVHPDPHQPLAGLLELRSPGDALADGFDERRLVLEVHGGTLSKPPTRIGAGLYRFELTAPEDAGGQELSLRLLFDGKTLAHRQVPIATDRWLAEGTAVPHGGCSIAALPSGPGLGWWAAPGLLLLLRSRRARASPKPTSRPDRRCKH
jgi:hypothetical protein